MRSSTFLVTFLVLLAVASARGEPLIDRSLPDYVLTPGLIEPRCTVVDICPHLDQGQASRHVDRAVKLKVCAEYGIHKGCPGPGYEIDHLISKELCGSDDIRNLWPESYTGADNAHDKDKVENYLHREVCAGRVTLTHAQLLISTDWRKVLPH